MKTIKGDLIELAKEGHFDIIVHGCNCFCTMNSGIAAQIKKEFPLAFEADQVTEKGDISKLGRIIVTQTMKNDHCIYVVNAYTQFKYGRDKRYVDYAALDNCFKQIAKLGKNRKIGFPKIGAGLAGGDWGKISEIIDKNLKGLDYILVEL